MSLYNRFAGDTWYIASLEMEADRSAKTISRQAKNMARMMTQAEQYRATIKALKAELAARTITHEPNQENSHVDQSR